jgi:MFS transporter, AAHS family, 4-hydroxybenzoate transporter
LSLAYQTIDLARFVDERRIGRFQLLVIGLCALTVFLDGFDTQSIAFVAPALAEAWGLQPAALGPIFIASTVGLLVGAVAFGTLADKIGRRRVLMICTAIFAIFTLATANAGSVTELLIFRCISGLGLGGGIPNAIALTAEYCPLRRRGTAVMVMFTGFSLGAAAAGAAAAVLIPRFGWPSVWLIGGILPLLLLLPLQVLLLPDSLYFMVLSGAARDRIAGILRRLDRTAPIAADARFVLGEEQSKGVPVAHLFKAGRGTGTVLLWVMFFAGLLDLFLLQNWIPIVTHEAGISVQTAVVIGTLFAVGGTAASLVLGFAVDAFGGSVVLCAMYLLGAIFVMLIGSTTSVPLLMLLTFLAGFCVVGSQNCANAVAALFYPAAIRSTGVGWSLGVGRIGAIAGPLVGASLVSLQWPHASIFLIASLPLFCAMAAAAVMTVTYRGCGSGAEDAALQNAAE